MLTFFRRIRKGLFEGGSTSKYLLYSIGEIALVVIGILIALQINNWNELRKERSFERNLLREVGIGLNRDIADIKFNYEYHQKALQSQDIIINWLEDSQPYHDSLCWHFSRALSYTFFVKNAGPYETMKSLGTHPLSNLELRDKITSLYEIFYDTYVSMESEYIDRIRNSIKNLNGKFFNVSEIYVVEDQNQFFPNPGCMTPINMTKIKSENEYKHFIKSLRSSNDFFMKYNMLNTKNKASEIESEIKAFLGDQ